MLFSRYKVAHEKKHKIMRNVASVAEATRSFLAEIDKVENLNRSEANASPLVTKCLPIFRNQPFPQAICPNWPETGFAEITLRATLSN